MQIGSYFIPRLLVLVAGALVLGITGGLWLVTDGEEAAPGRPQAAVVDPGAPVGRAGREAQSDTGISGQVKKDCPPRLKKTCPLRPQRGIKVTARYIAGPPPRGQKRLTSTVSKADGSFTIDLLPGPYALYVAADEKKSRVVTVYPNRFVRVDILLTS